MTGEGGALCWCGGEVGSRTPGDRDGFGCIESIWHVWREPPAPRTQKGLHNLLICCGPIPPGGTPGCCRPGPPSPCSYTTSTSDYCHTHGGHLADPSGDCDKRP